jgi:hypothetical protein
MTQLTGKILIIDDDVDVLHTARLILKKQFSTIRTESDPGNCMNCCRKKASMSLFWI